MDTTSSGSQSGARWVASTACQPNMYIESKGTVNAMYLFLSKFTASNHHLPKSYYYLLFYVQVEVVKLYKF